MAIIDESQPDLRPGIFPDLLLLLIDHGDGVVEESDTKIDQEDHDDHLR